MRLEGAALPEWYHVGQQKTVAHAADQQEYFASTASSALCEFIVSDFLRIG
jgi:hypothetical protein